MKEAVMESCDGAIDKGEHLWGPHPLGMRCIRCGQPAYPKEQLELPRDVATVTISRGEEQPERRDSCTGCMVVQAIFGPKAGCLEHPPMVDAVQAYLVRRNVCEYRLCPGMAQPHRAWECGAPVDVVPDATAAMTGYAAPTPRELAEEKVRQLLEWDKPTKALAFKMLRNEGMDSDRAKLILRDAKWTLP